MSTIDQQFVEYVVKALVGHPEDVVVERLIDEKGVLLTLTVNPEDLGRVIGKRGGTAQSLRTLLRALAIMMALRVLNKLRPPLQMILLWTTQQMKLWKIALLMQKMLEKSLQNWMILIYNHN